MDLDGFPNELNSLASTQVPPWPDRDLLDAALGIISNVGQGNWDRETTEWQQAARRWLEAYQRHIADSEVTGMVP